MHPPKVIAPHVLSFCESIVPNGQPKFVEVRPGKEAQPDNCIFNVQSRVKNNGGYEQIGWAIFEWPNVLIESIFHSVWVSPRNKLVDITPKRVEISRILFLPDASRRYEGRQVDGVRKPLNNDSDIERFCELVKLLFEEMNAGELADKKEIPFTQTMMNYSQESARLNQILIQRYGPRF